MLDISQLNKLRNIFDEQIDNLPKDVALCLSSGIDSVALLSLLLQHNKSVNVYSFTLDNYISVDFENAKNMANKFNLRFVPIYLPTDIDTLKTDVIKLHEQYNCNKKTDYECVWPFMYVYPKITESVIITGLGAEGHFGSTRKGSMHYKNDLDTFRKQFFGRDNVNQIKQHIQLCSEYSLNYWFPFMSNELYNFFMGKSWDDVNKPKIKQPILDLIDFEFQPKSSNLQVGSNIRTHFDTLLNTDWNIHNYKSVVGIFNAVNKGELPGANQKLF